MAEVEKLQGSARQALVLADQARAQGDETKAQEYEKTAQMFATQLVSAEQSMEDLKTLHDQALGAAGQARQAVENNAMILQQKLAERTKLLSQLEQAQMQETIARSLESMCSLAAPGNTPSLDEVREKIERRYANAMGRAELAANSVEGRMLEVQKSTLDMAGASRLEQIRQSMAVDGRAAAAGGRAGSGPAPAPHTGNGRVRRASPGSTRSGPACRSRRARLPAARPDVGKGGMADQRTKHLRRLRRLLRSARRWSVIGGGLSGATAILAPYAGLGVPDAAWAAGAGASVALAVWRWRDFREMRRCRCPIRSTRRRRLRRCAASSCPR